MHMKNWALEPTGIPGVFPLDPNVIPKFVNQLTKPPVHVAVGTRFDPTTGRNLPLYVVTDSGPIAVANKGAVYPSRREGNIRCRNHLRT
jgi:hypothetical protein